MRVKKRAHAGYIEKTFAAKTPFAAQTYASNFTVREELIGKGTFYSPARFQPLAIDEFGVDVLRRSCRSPD